MRVKIMPLAVVFAAFAVLVALGTWQVQRAQWKTNLLAVLAARQSAPIINVPSDIQNPADMEYRHMRARGQFLQGHTFFVGPRVEDGLSGYHLYVPFQTQSGAIIMVNRGFVKDKETPPRAARESEAIEGVARYPVKRTFTPDNDPAHGFWYWADAQGMARFAGLQHVLPITLDIKSGSTPILIPNHHKQYAVFWYTMALVLLGVAWMRFRQKEGARHASL